MKFKFPQTVEDISKVPAQFQFLYAENDEGAFALTEQGKPVAESISGLETALDKARKDAAKKSKGDDEDAAALAGLLEQTGAEDIAGLTTHIAGLNETIADSGNINPQKIKDELAASHAKELANKDAEIAKLNGTVGSTIVGSEIAQALSAHEGNPALLTAAIKARVKTVEEDGVFHNRVIDADGDFIGDGKGGWLSVNEFVGTLKEDPTFAAGFKAPDASGGGTPPGSQRTPAPPAQKPADKTATSKIAAGLANRTGRVHGAAAPAA